MEVRTLGKQRYAFGLTWKEVAAGITAQDALKTLGAPALYSAIESADGRQVVGWCDPAPAGRGVLYSYAEALARSGASGIYAVEFRATTGPRLWYVAVVDGMVVAETDVVTDDFDAAAQMLGAMRSALSLPLRYAGDTPLDVYGCETFDVDAAIASVRVKPMRRLRANAALRTVGLLLVAGAIGAGAWFVLAPPKPKAASPAEVAQQARAAYLAAMRSQLEQVPASTEWVINAFALSRNTFPDFLGGWKLDGVMCRPDGCTATYSTREISPHATAPMLARFQHVRALGDGMSLEVTLPMTVQRQVWGDNQILAPMPWPRPAADIAGLLMLQFDGLKVDGSKIETTDLAAASGMPGDARPLIQEKLAIKQAVALDAQRLAALCWHFGTAGFVPVTLAMSSGAGATPAAFRIEWVRLGGQPAP